MKRVITFVVVVAACLALSACQRWVGISSSQLVKRMGPPVNIVSAGDLSVYTYFDGLGGAPMKFYVDKDGIVRKWDATPVPAEFGIATDDTIGSLPIN